MFAFLGELWVFGALLAGVASGQAENVSLGEWTLTSSERVGRTLFEYTYQLSASNTGVSDLTGVVATATSTAATITVVDGAVSFGAIAAGATVTSEDTLSLRVDRRVPFDRSQVEWAVTATTTPPVTGVLLEGSPDALAVAALTDFQLISGSEENEIGLDATGQRVSRTQALVKLTPDTTVAVVNGLLESMNARIVWMMQDVPYLLVRFADPGSMDGLNAMLAQLEGSPAISGVMPGYFPSADTLPPPYDPADLGSLSDIDHLLAVGAAAGWNARGVLDAASPPLVLVADFFGAGPVLSPPFGMQVAEPFFFSNTAYDLDPSASGHGYHVLGIIGADYGNEPVTGMYPGTAATTLPVDVIDMLLDPRPDGVRRRKMDLLDTQTTLLTRLRARATTNRVVVNTSLGFDCADYRTEPPTPRNCDPVAVEATARFWIEAVRSAGLEEAFLHLTAAGNEIAVPFAPNDIDAAYASPWAAAALLPLEDESGAPIENLRNILVIENLVNEDIPPFAPFCLFAGFPTGTGESSRGSNLGGHLSAVGSDVASYERPQRGAIGYRWGTSMATPAVAGLAAYVWAFRDTLSVDELREILLTTAETVELPAAGEEPPGCRPDQPAPVIDAYAALLRADDPRGLTVDPSWAPVRLALLDVASQSGASGPDGIFSDADLERFVQGFGEGRQTTTPDTTGCGGYDWSRYDLNGDGRTGGCHLSRFDLDIDGQHETAAAQIAGQAFEFDEARVTDSEVLCYYAYSNLYVPQTGPDRRSALLREHCGGSTIETLAEFETPIDEISLCQEVTDEDPYCYLENRRNPQLARAKVAIDGQGAAFAVWVEPGRVVLGKQRINAAYDVGSAIQPDVWREQLCFAENELKIRMTRQEPGREAQSVTLFDEFSAGRKVADVAVTANEQGEALVVWAVTRVEDCRIRRIEHESLNGLTYQDWLDPVVRSSVLYGMRFRPDTGWVNLGVLWSDNTGWQTPRIDRLAGPDSGGGPIRIEMDRDGAAVVVWAGLKAIETAPYGPDYLIPRYDHQHAFMGLAIDRDDQISYQTLDEYSLAGRSEPFGDYNTGHGIPSLVMTPDGLFAVVVRRLTTGGEQPVRVGVHTRGGGWRPLEQMLGMGLSNVSADRTGRVLVTDMQPNARWWTASSGWSPVEFSPFGLPAGFAEVKMDLNGTLVAWNEGVPFRVMQKLAGSEEWSEPVVFSPQLDRVYSYPLERMERMGVADCGCDDPVLVISSVGPYDRGIRNFSAQRASLSDGKLSGLLEVYSVPAEESAYLTLNGLAAGSCGAAVALGLEVEYDGNIYPDPQGFISLGLVRFNPSTSSGSSN